MITGGAASLTIFASWYCMYPEAVDYFRERKRQRGWETSFETLPLSDHGDRDGGSKCVTTGSICVPKNIMILKSLKVQEKSFQAFFVFLLECSQVVGNKSSNKY